MLTRWEPLRDALSIQRTMDRFLEEFLGRPLASTEAAWALMPHIDLYETDDAIVLKATLPGVKPEDLEITITGDVLTLRGEVQEDAVEEGATYYLRERRFGTFSRSIRLPAPVVADEAEATFENGVLTLVLPKAEEARPKLIEVKPKGKSKGKKSKK